MVIIATIIMCVNGELDTAVSEWKNVMGDLLLFLDTPVEHPEGTRFNGTGRLHPREIGYAFHRASRWHGLWIFLPQTTNYELRTP